MSQSEFSKVTVIKKANIYFNGHVTSRSILFEDGSLKTLGIMLPGDYEFNTEDRELMEILSGELEVQLPDSDAWRQVKGGESFEVPDHARFKLKVKSLVDYCCSFLK